MSLNISQIRTDGGTQSRAAINEATVAEYAEAMADPNTVFPPVIVYFDGQEYWLADGFHRLAAWAQIGRTEIPTEIRQGDRRRAILHSVAANSAHGLRRTNEDKRRAVLTLLEDEEWAQWSDNKIAKQCAVDHKTVTRIRADHLGNSQDSAVRKVERNGTVYLQNTANIGAASKPDQEPEPQQSQAECAAPLVDSATASKTDQEIPAAPVEDIDPTTAKLRREIGKLTTDAMIDEIIGLRADLVDAKAKVRAQKDEITGLKARLADFTSDDKDGVIRALQAKLKNADSEKWRAAEDLRKAMSKNYALNKRVEELQQMGITL